VTSPRIAILGTGGTIQNTESGRLSLAEVLDEMRQRGPLPLEPLVDIETREVLSVGAEDIGPAEWRAIVAAVSEVTAREEVSGVVLTHGTFTAEETAFLLHLVVGTEKPVVMAVSQRKHGLIGNDGDRNLLDAVRVAADPAAVGRGVLLVVSDEIHTARDVVKEHQRLTGFRSAFGPIGTIETDQVTFYRRPERLHTAGSAFGPDALAGMPRVDIVPAYPGADAAAIDAYLDAGARGLVTAGYAYSGVTNPVQMRALQAAAERGVAVALASRGRGGRIPDAGRAWCVRADNLSPGKARILLGLALTVTQDTTELQRLFDMH
jgi:L-asparaginase